METAIQKVPATEEKLTGSQKAAILLVSLDQETAAKIFKKLNRREIEKISMEIASLKSVHSQTIAQIYGEFYQLLKSRDFVAEGGVDNARMLLEKALGSEEAKTMVEKLNSATQMRGFAVLKKADSSQLANFLNKEHPQTIALILSFLEPDQTASVLSEFPEELRTDVAHRIATLGKISPTLLREIEEVVDDLAESVIHQDLSKSGGVQALAEILNKSNKMTEKSILSRLEEIDPELAIQIKNKMFVFEDIVQVDDRGIQKVLKHIDKKDLALALKAADEVVKDKIFKNMSERASQLLKEDLEFLGPVRLREVEEAQRKIVEVIKQLEDDGEIIVAGRGKEDEIIV